MAGELERTFSSWRRYLDAEPWRRIDGDDLFRIRDDKSGEVYHASIMGRHGMNCGLVLTQGEEGLQILGAVIEQEIDVDQLATGSTSISISLHNEPLPDWYREFLRQSLGRGKSHAGWPLLYVNEGPRRPRVPRPDEVRVLADAMDAIVELHKRKALKPKVFKPGQPMPCVHLRADGRVDLTEETPEFHPLTVEPYRLPPESEEALRKLPQLDSTDLVSYGVLPATIQDRKVRMLAIHDVQEDLILVGECVELNDREATAGRLLAAYQGRNTRSRVGRPREIQTDSRYFYETFKDALGAVGISVACFESIPALERLRQSFADFLDRGGGP